MTKANPDALLELAEKRKLAALEKLLAGEPPYPVGTIVRQMQDEMAMIRARAQQVKHG